MGGGLLRPVDPQIGVPDDIAADRRAKADGKRRGDSAVAGVLSDVGGRFSWRKNARHASPDYSGLGWFRIRTEGPFAAGGQIHFCRRICFQGGNAATGGFPDSRRARSIVHGKKNISCSVSNDDRGACISCRFGMRQAVSLEGAIHRLRLVYGDGS
jgi:hypothetical protein